MLRRKNPLKKIIHACTQALINQVCQRSPAATSPVIGITRKLGLIHSPALARQKADTVHVLLLQQVLIMTHQLHQRLISNIYAVAENMKRQIALRRADFRTRQKAYPCLRCQPACFRYVRYAVMVSHRQQPYATALRLLYQLRRSPRSVGSSRMNM